MLISFGLGLIGGLIGGWVGHLLVVRRDIQSQKIQERNIRKVLQEEIDYNKQVLKEIVQPVRAEEAAYKKSPPVSDGAGGSYRGSDAHPWRLFKEYDLSRLSMDVWQTQMGQISASLASDELAKLFTFYRHLAEIQSRHVDYIEKRGRHDEDEPMQKILKLMEETVGIPLRLPK